MDYVNAFFEAVGGLLLCLNVRRLWKDRKISGVSILPTFFYASWGYWNLYYYPSLGQTWSFLAGFLVVGANTAWCVLALRFRTVTPPPPVDTSWMD